MWIARLSRLWKIALLSLIIQFAVLARICLNRHQIEPPAHDAVRLREETMAADVHAVALVANGARDAADIDGIFLQHYHVETAALRLKRGSQTGRAGTNNN